MTKKTTVKSIIFEEGTIFANNFFVFLCECFDILTTSRRYRSIGSWENALDDMRHKELFDKLKAKRALKDLRNKKWLEMRNKGQEIELRLTDKGEKALLKFNIQKQKNDLPNDQKCYVLFDFPVGANKARDSFRYYLKQCGFKKCQDSVWVSKKDIASYFSALVHRLNFAKWVRIIIGTDVSARGVSG
ncbi:MAG: hypothetical protein ABIH67_02640 [Candidatus Uhrbacteria bacterium]